MIAMMDFGELKILNGIRLGLIMERERIQAQKIFSAQRTLRIPRNLQSFTYKVLKGEF